MIVTDSTKKYRLGRWIFLAAISCPLYLAVVAYLAAYPPIYFNEFYTMSPQFLVLIFIFHYINIILFMIKPIFIIRIALLPFAIGVIIVNIVHFDWILSYLSPTLFIDNSIFYLNNGLYMNFFTSIIYYIFYIIGLFSYFLILSIALLFDKIKYIEQSKDRN